MQRCKRPAAKQLALLLASSILFGISQSVVQATPGTVPRSYSGAKGTGNQHSGVRFQTPSRKPLQKSVRTRLKASGQITERKASRKQIEANTPRHDRAGQKQVQTTLQKVSGTNFVPVKANEHESQAKQSAPAVSTNNPEPATLVGQILDAYGGVEKLREIDTMAFRSVGKIKEYSSISEAANTFDCTMISQGNKLRIEMNVMGQPLITAYDGRSGWLQQGDQVFPADPATVEHIQGEIRHSLEHELLALTEPKTKVSVLGTKEFGGKQCDVLTFETPIDRPVTMFVDPETHLVLRTEFMGIDSEQGIPAKITNDYFDYKPMFGTQEPFRVIEYTNDRMTTEAVQTNAELEKTLSDAFFSMPAEKRLARLAEGPVEIPFEYVYNQILIKARVNGQKDATFIVDTGASQSMLEDKFANSVGTTQESNYSVTTGSGSMKMNYIIAKTLQLGDLQLDDVALGVTSGEAFAQMHTSRPDGLIGANILKRFLVTFDYQNRKIILTDPHEMHVPDGASVIATKPAMGNLGIVIEGTLNNRLKIPFLVDTGAAFNNISSTLLKPLFDEKLLPVSKILGLDGQQVDVGALKLDSLRLGNLSIDKPVFSVAAAPADSKGTGIITSKSLAILGNPLWSRFRLTIDYRHNRIYLEQTPPQEALANITEQLDKISANLRNDKNWNNATEACKKLLESDEGKTYPPVLALVHAEMGSILVEQAREESDREKVFAAKEQFETAQKIASLSKDSIIQGRIYAQLARHIGEMDPSLTSNVKVMLGKAIKLAPMDPEVLTSAAMVLKKSGGPLVEKVIDQALSADPSNWDALWFRYKLSQELKQPDRQKLVALQLMRYYPQTREVQDLAENKQPAPAVSSIKLGTKGGDKETTESARKSNGLARRLSRPLHSPARSPHVARTLHSVHTGTQVHFPRSYAPHVQMRSIKSQGSIAKSAHAASSASKQNKHH